MKVLLQFKIASIAVMLLGIIHLCATPVVFPIFKSHAHINMGFVYMFVLVGISVLFVGWLQNFILRNLGKNRFLLTILKITVLFVCISGVGGVATMWNNPFAYIILFVALYEVILLKNLAKDSFQ